MTDNKPETESQKQVQEPAKRRKPMFTMIFLYVIGFYITQKSDFDSSTGLGIAMLVFGWLCILLCLASSVSFLFGMFKKQS